MFLYLLFPWSKLLCLILHFSWLTICQVAPLVCWVLHFQLFSGYTLGCQLLETELCYTPSFRSSRHLTFSTLEYFCLGERAF